VDFLLGKAEMPGSVGEQALAAVGSIRSANPAARKKLADALARANDSRHAEEAKANLLLALGALKDAGSVPAIASYVDDGDPKVRASAVRALGRVGAPAREHVARLVTLFEGGDEALRMNVAVALASIGGEAAIAAMERMLAEGKLSSSLEKTLRMGVRAARDDLEKDRGASGR
jgi:HEAT repeat protein